MKLGKTEKGLKAGDTTNMIQHDTSQETGCKQLSSWAITCHIVSLFGTFTSYVEDL